MLRLLHALRDAITQADQRLPCVVVCFVAQGLGITVRPTHEQYKPLNAYVVSRPFLPLDEVPLFFSHFHSGSPSQYHDRLFLLSLLQQAPPLPLTLTAPLTLTLTPPLPLALALPLLLPLAKPYP